MTGIVLAGGRSARMGFDKATLPWQNSDFLHVIVNKLSKVCNELIVVTNAPRPSGLSGVRFASDIIPCRGPLSGIHTGLVLASSPTVFVTACDMPFIEPAAVSWLFSQIQDLDAVVPGDDAFLEPLFACYSKSCIPAIETLLSQDIRKVHSLFRLIRCNRVPLDELRNFDPTLRLLRNINSPEDYQSALDELKNPSML